MRKMNRVVTSLAASGAALTLLAGCAGSLGNSVAQESGEGFAFGADQSEVDVLLADLEPITLTFQPGASSPESPTAANGMAFQQYVEERSGGKITLDMVWGQAIAPYSEVVDALTDGRLDIAYHAAIYFPNDFPTVDAFSKITQYSTPAPLTGEAISAAMMSELAWNSDEHLQTIEDQGLAPLSPLMSSGDYWTACTKPGTALEDWKGRQLRIAGTAHTALTEAIGASPVSMEYGETFEALQRGTVDCTFVQPQVAGSSGLLAVAPHVSHFAEQRMTGGATGIHVAGSSFDTLPLAYQQIIFDAEVDQMHGMLHALLDSGHKGVVDAREAGGDFSVIDSEVEATLAAKQEELVDELIEAGRLPEDIRDEMTALADKWTGIVAELGYTDDGDLATFDEWYEPSTIDFRPLTERVFTEAAEQHRPGNPEEAGQ